MSIHIWRDAIGQLKKWMTKNQNTWIGASEEGREILGEYGMAFLDFLYYHPEVEGDPHLNLLLELLDQGDDDPPPGKEVPNEGSLANEGPFHFS